MIQFSTLSRMSGFLWHSSKWACWFICFNIRQGLKCKHEALAPTLTMWLLCSKCTLPWTTKCLGAFSYYPRPFAQFSWKMHKFSRSLAEYLAALTFLCDNYIIGSYITWLTVSLNMCTSIYISFFVFIVFNSNYFDCIQIYFKPV